MPDVPIKPPNKREAELITELTLNISEKFEDEKIILKRYQKMITYLTSELASALIKLDEKE